MDFRDCMLQMGMHTLKGLVSIIGNGAHMIRRSSVLRPYAGVEPSSLSS